MKNTIQIQRIKTQPKSVAKKTKNISKESHKSSDCSENIFNMKATAQKGINPGEHINLYKSSEDELIEDNGTFSYGTGAGQTLSFELK